MEHNACEGLTAVKRTFKASIFEMLFSERERLLELYNAVNGTDYQDPNLLEVNTLENAIYMAIRNDVSFVIDGRLSLYKHQSTYSANLTLRFLFYVSDLFSAMTKEENLYRKKGVKLPSPRFLIFYNGEEKMEERKILRLSELYSVEDKMPALELEAVMLNINQGYNLELLDASETLQEYVKYTQRVRKYAGEMELTEAVERAITECIREGILADFLKQNRSEAKKVSIYEYDVRMEREEAREEGIEQGIVMGKQELLKNLIQKKLQKGLSVPEIAQMLETEEETVRRLMEETGSGL